MQKSTDSQPIQIVNVGILDLRKATKESLPAGSKLVNVGIIVHDQDPRDLLAGVSMVNTGPIRKAPPAGEWGMSMGPVVVTRGMLEEYEVPLNLCAMGPIEIDPDVEMQTLERKMGILHTMGPVICPEHLLPAVQSKVIGAMRPISSYRCPPSVQFVRGKVVIDQDYLIKLADSTEFAVLGHLQVSEVLDNDLIQKKLTKLYVTGGLTCHVENLDAIQSVLADRTTEIKTIPAGHALVIEPLTLDNVTLTSLPSPKLYCTRQVQITPDADPAILSIALETLICEELVICPASLKPVIRSKGDWFKTRLVVYEGTLWHVDDELYLGEHHFDFLEDKATLLVEGELFIDQAVSPQTLSAALHKVHNLGVIWCTPEQIVALRPLLGLKNGDLLDSTVIKKQAPEMQEALDFGSAKYFNIPYVTL
ncbi:MAG: hypothetical protein JXA33_26345 [Anaerolineae bacterium]|nr:hypothetical protein [Anaerolineae bacterium]